MSTKARVAKKNSKASKIWYDDDRFWKAIEPFLFTPARMVHAEEEIGHLVDLLKLSEGAKVLDLCCGPGRHSVALAKRGFSVTGVDRSSRFLRAARKRAAATNVDMEFIQEDARRFRRKNAFDVVINLYTSFGYFEAPGENVRVLRNVYASLRKGGRFVIDVMGKEVLAGKFADRTWSETDGAFLLEERKVSRDWTWMENRWIVIGKDGRRIEQVVSHYLYSAAELKRMLKDCGFQRVEAFGSLDGAPYDHRSLRLVVMGGK